MVQTLALQTGGTDSHKYNSLRTIFSIYQGAFSEEKLQGSSNLADVSEIINEKLAGICVTV